MSFESILFFFLLKGGAPYPKVDSKAIASLLEEGYRMPKPPHLADKLWVTIF